MKSTQTNKAARDNRANQLNPNNSSYYSSRGAMPDKSADTSLEGIGAGTPLKNDGGVPRRDGAATPSDSR